MIKKISWCYLGKLSTVPVEIVWNAVRRNVEFWMLRNVVRAFIIRLEAAKFIHLSSAVALHFCSKCILKASIKSLLETPADASTVSKFASVPLTISFELGGGGGGMTSSVPLLRTVSSANTYQSCHLHDTHSLRVSWKLVVEGAEKGSLGANDHVLLGCGAQWRFCTPLPSLVVKSSYL